MILIIVNLIEQLKQKDNQDLHLSLLCILAALKTGYRPNTKVLDAPLVIDQGPGLEEWKPKNYSGDFYGPSTLRVGFGKIKKCHDC